MPFFDLNALRRRAKMHDLAAEGLTAEQIGQRMNMSTEYVTKSLRRTRPILNKPESTLWVEDAACKGADVDLFFPKQNGNGAVFRKRKAVQLCGGCPVRKQCLSAAQSNYESHGVWGGVDFSRFYYNYIESTGQVEVRLRRNQRGAVTQVS